MNTNQHPGSIIPTISGTFQQELEIMLPLWATWMEPNLNIVLHTHQKKNRIVTSQQNEIIFYIWRFD